MTNIHKNPIAWMGLALGVFGVSATFIEQHCTVTPSDFVTLAVALFTFLSGYFHGKDNTGATPVQPVSTPVTPASQLS